MTKKKTKKTSLVLKAPLTEKDIKSLNIGDRVLISGTIYAARDSAHKLFGKNPPFEIKGSILFYASPTPAKKGQVIGSIGPTTASRMDPYTVDLLKKGLKITIGKGLRSQVVKDAMKKYQAIYLVVPGGISAGIAKHILKSTIIAYPELGPEAVLELEATNLPAIVAIDCKGKDLFEVGKKKYQTK
ncbi:hypothetical protein A2291_07630 [candidate division WOR-1 bacterium RIFOXYB2_FULL_42_35]|uniref:Fe-S hydro-lyase tartrate dehydratase beta-type catalytic domain-containing protein n=1 Tax=candidate division WOR-1 bacterium RIFOXYC2_FULL_41_25 TaxID=1802586 RepID=A0A1F4TKW1_UNCSA|nr:MAG: hypothetical protein A2247_08155 [candidate division WOR-1 bacterium RIFOXYA2_FULL_41_14]OGC21795.1 MAG: hypothetical protein A2291_07630 [candidate division WOR-1 bacterium RIFOXYB2_FULL_42_35]OGC32693.1 MAG: hypothetical protein A2462_04020 [candidate division WOR-1 bacterium RIFOXYC2_FULL_41_25]OGC41546.1 MAG: hypothetical protein A2548_01630 [candidate division WOR-1 bacterium RIFOXYD2_FULL_41_8]